MKRYLVELPVWCLIVAVAGDRGDLGPAVLAGVPGDIFGGWNGNVRY